MKCLDRFLDYTVEKKLELYPAQEEAVLELLQDSAPYGVRLHLHFFWR